MPAKIAITVLEWFVTVALLIIAEKIVKSTWTLTKLTVANIRARIATAEVAK